MKNLNTLLAGVFLAVALPFGALVISSQVQLGSLGRAPAEDGGPLFPSREPGLAVQGRAVYVSLGCVSCHTQQVRPAGQGSDIARGYGVRPSVARDYSQQKQVLLGDRRIGPDLANYGVRAKEVAAVHEAINTMALLNSSMPATRSRSLPSAPSPSRPTSNPSARITPRRKPN